MVTHRIVAVFSFILIGVMIGFSACAAPAVTPTGVVGAPQATLSAVRATAGALASQTATALPSPSPSPTPTAQPTPEAITYTVRSGDTLFSIAQRHGLTVDELLAVNQLADPNRLAPGQTLRIPLAGVTTGPAQALLPDSELVYGPGYMGFDVESFVAGTPGWLNAYRETINGRIKTGAQLVQEIALQYSVGPRVLLTLLELRAGALSDPNPDEDARRFPMGYRVNGWDKLSIQLSLAADDLNAGFYAQARGEKQQVVLAGGERRQLDAALNPGTAGVQRALAQGVDVATWESWLGAEGFSRVYRRWFGDPWTYAIEPLWPTSPAPELALPWPRGTTWYFTGGPHGGWDEGSAWAALDFVPEGTETGCYVSNDWATAAAPGLILYSDEGMVLLDMDQDGFAGSGWVLLYLHVRSEGRVAVGTQVQTGDPIGHPSCEGGASNATHLHFARRYNGVWIAAFDPRWPLVLGGWQALPTAVAYDGFLQRGAETREACECRQPLNALPNP